MKNLLLILFISISGFATAQQPPEDNKRAEKIQALKIAFISQKLELTSDEAQKFWPVYNNYEIELRQLLRENRQEENVLDSDEKLLNLRKKFKPEFARILGQPRVNKLFGAEREFRHVLMKQLKNNGNRQQRPPLRRQN